MKNRSRISIFLICVVTMVFMVGLAGCSDMLKKGKGYTITYMEGETAKTIAVEKGGSFALSPVPTKEGYTFQGLFDSADKQYINKDGLGLFAYDLDSDLTLSIKWAPIECQLILDYRGGKVEGAKSIKILYGENVTALPTTTKENYIFTGWFTQPNGKGVQIADEYGILPLKEVFTSATYEITNGVSTIYAGFDIVKYNVTFYFSTESGATSETIKIPHGETLRNFRPSKTVNGLGVVSWSITKNGNSEYTDLITGDLAVYPLEWGYVISFEEKDVLPIIEKEYKNIILPKPKKEGFEFDSWRNEKDEIVTFEKMPGYSTKLFPKWKVVLTLNVNNGESEKTIITLAGKSITLPTPQRSGFEFAGWYTQDEQIFNASVMPNKPLTLTAKYKKVYSYELKAAMTADEVFSTGKYSGYTFDEASDLEFFNSIPPDVKVNVDIDFDLTGPDYMLDSLVDFKFSMKTKDAELGYMGYTINAGDFSGWKHFHYSKEIKSNEIAGKVQCFRGSTTNYNFDFYASELIIKYTYMSSQLY